MNLSREESEIIMTALQNYRGELYMNGSNPEALNKVNNLVQNIEDEMESKDIGQKKIPVTEDMYKVKEKKSITMAEAVDINPNVGSETGIERDYANQGKPGCEVCDD